MKTSYPDTIAVLTNENNQSKEVLLSVLVPFFNDNPVKLIKALSNQACNQVELILIDDGSQNDELTSQVSAAILATKLPAKLLTAEQNKGRSIARNRLRDTANGEYLLLLDADMLPAQQSFLATYIQQIQTIKPDILFGGFSVIEQSTDHSYDLHRALSARSDCLSAEQRNILPAKHVCSSNLLVRTDVLETCPFDPGFVGWGWEDVEWAARAAEHFKITHIDNPALHLGLESAETLIRRYRDSAANYARFVARHPKLAKELPSYRTAKLAGRIPALKLLRPLLTVLAKDPWHVVPMALRIFALKLWRAGWYAEELA